MGYSKVNPDEIEPTGPGGMVRFVRRELDLQAFLGARRGSYEPRGPY